MQIVFIRCLLAALCAAVVARTRYSLTCYAGSRAELSSDGSGWHLQPAVHLAASSSPVVGARRLAPPETRTPCPTPGGQDEDGNNGVGDGEGLGRCNHANSATPPFTVPPTITAGPPASSSPMSSATCTAIRSFTFSSPGATDSAALTSVPSSFASAPPATYSLSPTASASVTPTHIPSITLAPSMLSSQTPSSTATLSFSWVAPSTLPTPSPLPSIPFYTDNPSATPFAPSQSDTRTPASTAAPTASVPSTATSTRAASAASSIGSTSSGPTPSPSATPSAAVTGSASQSLSNSLSPSATSATTNTCTSTESGSGASSGSITASGTVGASATATATRSSATTSSGTSSASSTSGASSTGSSSVTGSVSGTVSSSVSPAASRSLTAAATQLPVTQGVTASRTASTLPSATSSGSGSVSGTSSPLLSPLSSSSTTSTATRAPTGRKSADDAVEALEMAGADSVNADVAAAYVATLEEWQDSQLVVRPAAIALAGRIAAVLAQRPYLAGVNMSVGKATVVTAHVGAGVAVGYLQFPAHFTASGDDRTTTTSSGAVSLRLPVLPVTVTVASAVVYPTSPTRPPINTSILRLSLTDRDGAELEIDRDDLPQSIVYELPVNQYASSGILGGNFSATCVFWDGELSVPGWSDHECSVVNVSFDTVTCACYVGNMEFGAMVYPEGAQPWLHPYNGTAVSSDDDDYDDYLPGYLSSLFDSVKDSSAADIHDAVRTAAQLTLRSNGTQVFSYGNERATIVLQPMTVAQATIMTFQNTLVVFPAMQNRSSMLLSAVLFASNPFPAGTLPDTQVLTLSVLDAAGAEVSIHGLPVSDMVHFTLPLLVPLPLWLHASQAARYVKCQYWDANATSWAADGCVATNVSASSIHCACTHLTDFSARLLSSMGEGDGDTLSSPSASGYAAIVGASIGGAFVAVVGIVAVLRSTRAVRVSDSFSASDNGSDDEERGGRSLPGDVTAGGGSLGSESQEDSSTASDVDTVSTFDLGSNRTLPVGDAVHSAHLPTLLPVFIRPRPRDLHDTTAPAPVSDVEEDPTHEVHSDLSIRPQSFQNPIYGHSTTVQPSRHEHTTSSTSAAGSSPYLLRMR